MLYYFKSSTLLYFGMILAGLVSLPLVKVMGFEKDLFSFEKIDLYLYLFFILWIFISAFISNIYAVKKMNEFLKILKDKCDPIEYSHILENLINKRRYKNRFYNTLLLNLSTALIEAGKVDEAFQILNRINKFPNSKLGKAQKILYYNNLIIVYLKKDELKNAEKALINMRETIEDKQLNKHLRNRYQKFLIQKHFLFNIEQGNYEGAEEFFEQMYENVDSNIDKVSAKFTLGRVYVNLGKLNDAKEAFTYVTKNGNTLAMVKEAKNYLDRIIA